MPRIPNVDKLSDDDMMLINNRILDGESAYKIAKQFHLCYKALLKRLPEATVRVITSRRRGVGVIIKPQPQLELVSDHAVCQA